MFDASAENTKIDLTVAQFNVLLSAYLTAMVEDGYIDIDSGFAIKSVLNTMMKDLVEKREECLSVIEQLMVLEKEMMGKTQEDVEDEVWDIISAANKISRKATEEMN